MNGNVRILERFTEFQEQNEIQYKSIEKKLDKILKALKVTEVKADESDGSSSENTGE